MAYKVYKKKATFGQKMQARAALGGEPTFESGIPLTRVQLLNNLNWYHKICGTEEARTYLKAYYERAKKPKEWSALDDVPDERLSLTAAWIVRMALRGAKFEGDVVKHARSMLEEMISYSVSRTYNSERTVRDAMLEKANQLIAEVEEIIDIRDPEFSMYEWLTAWEVPGKVADQILLYYKPLLEELTLAKTGKDPELFEAYKPMGKRRFLAYYEFVANLVDDLEKFVGNSKKTRKVRKSRKSKPIDVQKKLKLFKYLEKDDSMKLQSINPASIVGAQELWTYNPTYKMLVVYRAAGPSGLDISRSSVTGFDPASSVGKRVGRNIQEALNNVLTGGKVVRRKLLDGVNAASTQPTGRINNGTILLFTAR